MLASRARGRLRLCAPTAAAHAAARDVVDAFLAAAGRGDVAGLLTVLAPEVELRAQGPQGTIVVRGAGEVAAQATRFARPDALAHPALVDGVRAFSSPSADGRSRSWPSRSRTVPSPRSAG
jgi:RNA polymerase sigma-70 factor (ECF subfamily)